jgi:archaellum biogenesis protein FlaJ (TadC family)
MKHYLKIYFEIFLSTHFLVTIVMSFCGMMLGKEDQFHYSGLLLPALYAFFCSFLIFLSLHHERMTTRQLIKRRLLQLIIGEVVVLSLISIGVERDHTLGQWLILASAVPIVMGGLCFFDWLFSHMEADGLNRELKAMQNRNSRKQ